MAAVTRSFELDGFEADDVRTLRIGSARNDRIRPLAVRLTKGEARMLHTLLTAWLGDYVHAPEGCAGDGCPCRKREGKR